MVEARSLAASLTGAGFRGQVRQHVPLAPMTTWRIGGPAELLAVPADAEDVGRAIAWARDRGVDWRVLGNGSNLLVRDEGVRGLVVRVRRTLDDVRIADARIESGAGAFLPALANQAAERGLSGLEYAAGIPGTVGGAVVMNAGWHEHEIGEVVERVTFVGAGGEIEETAGADCRFGYRSSVFRGARNAILEVRLRLSPDDPRRVAGRVEAYQASRRAHQPTESPTCGSVFLKPPGDFAGRLIEAAGLKGTREGDLEVSPKHANFIVNHGRGSARDALALVERIEVEVLNRFGVRLEREFELW